MKRHIPGVRKQVKKSNSGQSVEKDHQEVEMNPLLKPQPQASDHTTDVLSVIPHHPVEEKEYGKSLSDFSFSPNKNCPN